MSGLGRKLLVGLVFGALVCTVILLAGDAGAMAAAVRAADAHWLACAAACSICIYAGRFLKWQVFLGVLRIEVPLWESLRIFLSGISMGITPGKVGEVLKSYILRETHGVDFSRTAPTVVAERLTGVLGCMLLCLVSLAVLGQGTWYSFVVCMLAFVVSAAVFAFFRCPLFARLVFSLLGRLSRLARARDALQTMYLSLADILNVRTIALCVVISVGYWFMECLVFYALLQAFGIGGTLAHAVFVLTSLSIGGGLTLLPGSIGALEGGLIGVLVYEGATASTAGAVTLLHRFFAMWLYVLVGAGILLKWYRKCI